MNIKTPFCVVKIDILLLVVIIITVFFSNIKNLISSYYMCYLFIVFHELAHVFVGSLFGRKIEKIEFSLSGVCASFEKKRYTYIKNKNTYYSLFTDLLIYIAGPLSNILLAIVFKNNIIIITINISLAMLNLIPIYPLDGYNILSIFVDIIYKNNRGKILIYVIQFVFILVLVMFAILQIIYLNNISILIFLIYIFIQINIHTKMLKNADILHNLTY